MVVIFTDDLNVKGLDPVLTYCISYNKTDEYDSQCTSLKLKAA